MKNMKNMKNYIIYILLLLFSTELFSQDFENKFIEQHQVVDTMLLRIKYDFRFMVCPRIEKMPNIDSLYLEIGCSSVHSYVQSERDLDIKIETTLAKTGKRKSITGKWYAKIGEIYHNFPENKITVLTGMDIAGVFRHIEPIPDFNWQVTNEKKKILRYSCQKATCSFRGRDYEAWFTPEIPMSYGPWKFRGLPGLILEVKDTKGAYVFVCKGVEKPKGKHITYWNRKYTDCDRKFMRKHQRILCKKPVTYMSGYGDMKYTNKGPIKDEEWGYEPNPIELE